MSDEQPSGEASTADPTPTPTPAAGSPGQAGNLTLAEKLDRCIRTMHAPDRGPWTLQEIADGTAAIANEGSWSQGYLSKVRAGKVTNPSSLHIQTLARFFRVPVTYFIGNPEEVEAIDAEIAFVQAMRSPQVKDIALRANSMSPRGLRAVTRIVEAMAEELESTATPADGNGRNSSTPSSGSDST